MPKFKEQFDHNSTALLNEKSPFAIIEAYAISRSNLRNMLMGVNGCKIVAVTSASPGDGKTTICLNLAISIAKAGSKVLVIDADMRRGSINKYLGLENNIGLSNVLTGYTNLDKAIQVTENGISCMTSGMTPSAPAELLMSDLMRELLELLSSHYDYILIDTPPFPMTSDALSLNDYISGYVVATRYGHTSLEDLDKTVKGLQFANAKIFGVICNDAQGKGGNSYYHKYNYYSNNSYNPAYSPDQFDKK